MPPNYVTKQTHFFILYTVSLCPLIDSPCLTQHAEAVLDCDKDDVVVEEGVGLVHVSAASQITSTVDINEHWQTPVRSPITHSRLQELMTE